VSPVQFQKMKIQKAQLQKTILLTTGAEENAQPYIEALRMVGVPGERLRVLTPEARGGAAALVADAAGLVLCGGADVDPARYGEAPRPDAGLELVAERDELEWELLGAVREARLPVWGVCRGLQVLNVFLGGSLWQDLPTQLPGLGAHAVSEPKDALTHLVQPTAKPTRLGELLSREPALVNSRHHQALKRLAPGLVPAALSPDGLVEAAEMPVGQGGAGSGWWVRGVQWHPENLTALAQQRVLWEVFARTAADWSASRPVEVLA
jgi:putative glutamine amidotransferase